MSKKKESVGFGGRVEKTRLRLDYKSKRSFARALGVPYETYQCWTRDASPTGAILKRGLKGLRNPLGRPLSYRAQLQDWMYDGEDAPPAWVDDVTLDPYAPEIELPAGAPRPALAMPQAAVTKLREARRAFRQIPMTVLTRDSSGGQLLRAIADLEDGMRGLPGLQDNVRSAPVRCCFSNEGGPALASVAAPVALSLVVPKAGILLQLEDLRADAAGVNEPPQREPKSLVLPLHHGVNRARVYTGPPAPSSASAFACAA